MVVPCLDGYTIYIDVSLSYDEKIEAYHHAMKHIKEDHWQTDKTADEIEVEGHEQKETL